MQKAIDCKWDLTQVGADHGSVNKRQVKMKKWLYLSSYHGLALFVMLCVCSICLAWTSYGLLRMAMLNFDLLHSYGVQAALDGGLIQLVQIGLQAFLALLSFLGFKGIETELIARWRNHDGH